MKEIIYYLKFSLEKLLLRGARYQLLIIACLIVLISVCAGILALLFTGEFSNLSHSTWWAFLHLSDPGYLGDDQGLVLRTVATVVTILGYVVFMGALIAILTQWLNQTLKHLEMGLTSIHKKDHVLVLGWTNRTASIVREMLVSEGRVGRFLKRIGARRLHIVILAEEVNVRLANELQAGLGDLYHESRITLRSGSHLRLEHLQRVDFMNAAVILLPGTDFKSDGSDTVDTRAIMALITMSNAFRHMPAQTPPMVVTEIFDTKKLAVAKRAYAGAHEIVAGNAVISRLIAQNIRHQGLSHIFTELLTHNQGNEIFIRECPQFEGLAFCHAATAFRQSILIGVLRLEKGRLIPMLNPPPDSILQKGDRFAILARTHEASEPTDEIIVIPTLPKPQINNAISRNPFRLLILGWNHKIPSLLEEFDSYEEELFFIDIMSLLPVKEREEFLARHGIDFKHVQLTQIMGDYTAPADLIRVKPDTYDNILFAGNYWLDSNEESDARVILGSLILEEITAESPTKPKVIMELMDPANERLFLKKTGEVLITPLILSHILAHVALRRELNVVFEELFTVGGAEIYFRAPVFYGIAGDAITFKEIQTIVTQMGDIAIGVRKTMASEEQGGGIILNPSPDNIYKTSGLKSIVVLTTYA